MYNTQQGFVYTVRPVVHMFADVAWAYQHQGLATPDHVQDAWEQYKRIEEHALLQLELGLWEPA